MFAMCYVIEMNSATEDLFNALDDYGFDYWCDDSDVASGMIEIIVDYYPHEISVLDDIFAPYV